MRENHKQKAAIKQPFVAIEAYFAIGFLQHVQISSQNLHQAIL